ncbi:nicotinate (nicotinamide) nucleotide adenylyltransferase [Porphyromonas gingivicanis]|nr:nicotinate (nicotinamide) nucleotide adenylyltransferase [Porphyromonas gingivicanis]
MGVHSINRASTRGMYAQENLTSVAVFAGTFDPIHIGHTALANYLLTEDFGFDELWFVPAMQNPLKAHHSLLDFDARCRLIQATIKGDTRFRCCPIEETLPAPYYTIHTILALQKQYPDHRFTLLVGADNWACFDKWYRWEALLDLLPVVVYPRHGFGFDASLSSKVVYAIDAPFIEVSSTKIREALLAGRDLRYWLPRPELFEEVKKHMLPKVSI